MSFSPQAELLAVGSWDKKVRIYEVSPSGETQGRAMYDHQSYVLTTQWTQDGSKVISGGCDNAVRVYDLQSGQSIQAGQHDQPVSSVRAVTVAGGQQVIASSSWDKTLKYWDMRAPTAISTVQLPERAYTMDSSKNLLVVGTAERHICIFDLSSNPGAIFKSAQSPLKWQTRVVSCYPTGNGFAVGSIEGRCAIQYVDAEEQKKLGFSFKCHREAVATKNESIIYPVNSINFHPEYGTFSTAGSDGIFNFWDKEAKCRLKGSKSVGGTISTTAFNRNGSIFAYAVSYDWSKGHQFNTQNYPNKIMLHPVQDEEIKSRKK
ncbi:mRNA export factor Gle2p [Trichomonascus vanleenenianus]|uniref:WD40 repeat domain-containing protein n=1 Tax=Trichomonascus vanleenenianus TaxID=2268995 RepID=UPI003ECABBD7